MGVVGCHLARLPRGRLLRVDDFLHGGRYRGGVGGSMAEVWNGSSWSPTPTPNPAGATQIEVEDVSCSSASACTAVGSYSEPGGRKPMALRWNGTAWSLQSVPVGSEDKSVELYDVSCFSDVTATSCVAVGKKSTGPFAERWNGTEWSVMTPVGSGNLTSVSCGSASFLRRDRTSVERRAPVGVLGRQQMDAGDPAHPGRSVVFAKAEGCLLRRKLLLRGGAVRDRAIRRHPHRRKNAGGALERGPMVDRRLSQRSGHRDLQPGRRLLQQLGPVHGGGL